MFLVVFRIIERTGCLSFMVTGLLGYAIRFIVFAVIQNPWIVLPFEVLQGKRFIQMKSSLHLFTVSIRYICINSVKISYKYLFTNRWTKTHRVPGVQCKSLKRLLQCKSCKKYCCVHFSFNCLNWLKCFQLLPICYYINTHIHVYKHTCMHIYRVCVLISLPL